METVPPWRLAGQLRTLLADAERGLQPGLIRVEKVGADDDERGGGRRGITGEGRQRERRIGSWTGEAGWLSELAHE
jgi:hypothetical protein